MKTEFGRAVRLDTIGDGRDERIEADEDERAALAARFGLDALDALSAEWRLRPVTDGVAGEARIVASGAQNCVTTGEPVRFAIDTTEALLFAHEEPGSPDEEMELDERTLDRVAIEGGTIDLGEATAQSLVLALDPYPRAPDADTRRRDLGIATEVEASPFAALLGLKGSGW